MEIKYKIGQKYTPRRKQLRECTIVDVLKTYNNNGDLVKVRYVSTHLFMGQIVIDSDVVQTTIDMSGINPTGALT